MTNADLVVANITILMSISLVMACLMAFRAYDLAVAGEWRNAVVRAGVCITFAGMLLSYSWWFLRWKLREAGQLELSEWFVEHGGVTLVFGAVATAGAVISVCGVLWPRLRLTGVALAHAVAFSVWLVALLK